MKWVYEKNIYWRDGTRENARPIWYNLWHWQRQSYMRNRAYALNLYIYIIWVITRDGNGQCVYMKISIHNNILCHTDNTMMEQIRFFPFLIYKQTILFSSVTRVSFCYATLSRKAVALLAGFTEKNNSIMLFNHHFSIYFICTLYFEYVLRSMQCICLMYVLLLYVKWMFLFCCPA